MWILAEGMEYLPDDPPTYSESALRAVKLTNIIRRTYSPRKPERSTNIKYKFRLVDEERMMAYIERAITPV